MQVALQGLDGRTAEMPCDFCIEMLRARLAQATSKACKRFLEGHGFKVQLRSSEDAHAKTVTPQVKSCPLANR